MGQEAPVVVRPYLLAVTLYQPWAWAFRHAGKRIENRDWAPPEVMQKLDLWRGRNLRFERGDPLAIHAAGEKSFDDIGYDWLQKMLETGSIVADAPLPGRPQDFTHSAIDGIGTYWGSVRNVRGDSSQQVWRSETEWAHVLDRYWPLPKPVTCRGYPLLWPIPADELEEVIDQWNKAIDQEK